MIPMQFVLKLDMLKRMVTEKKDNRHGKLSLYVPAPICR